MFIDKLIGDGVLNPVVPIHLMGMVLPQEVSLYQDYRYSFVKSVNTSNPVVNGLNRVRYANDGLDSKVPIMNKRLIDHEVSPSQWTDIKFNIKKFKNFAGYDRE